LERDFWGISPKKMFWRRFPGENLLQKLWDFRALLEGVFSKGINFSPNNRGVPKIAQFWEPVYLRD